MSTFLKQNFAKRNNYRCGSLTDLQTFVQAPRDVAVPDGGDQILMLSFSPAEIRLLA